MMATVTGEATAPHDPSHPHGIALLIEALQHALENAPPLPLGTDVQNFRLLAIEMEHGGFIGSTKTRVTLDVQPGPLKEFKG